MHTTHIVQTDKQTDRYDFDALSLVFWPGHYMQHIKAAGAIAADG